MLRRLLLTLSAIVVLFVSSSRGQAGVVGTAEIDWSSLSFSLINLDPNNPVSFSWNAGSEYGQTSTSAITADPLEADSASDFATDFTTPLVSSAVTSLAWADAIRSSSLLSASASGQSGVSAAAPNWNYSSADSYNYGGYTVTGHGIVLLTVNWALSVTGLAGDSDAYSYASAQIYADYHNALTSGSTSSSAWLQSMDNGDNATSGMFSIAIVSLPGTTTTGVISADAYAYASVANVVPEPSTLALTGMGIGVVGLLVYRRRRS